MNKKIIITALLAIVAMAGQGQTDTKGGMLSGMETDVQPFDFSKPMMADSLRFQQIIPSPELLQDVQQKPLTYDRTTSFLMPADKSFKLWSGASIIVYGGNNQMLGLMDAATGAVSLHQDFGRLHFAASAVANKYWMPMQSRLYTQYGIGGSLGYDLTDAVSLHAFGYYYANNPLVGPAFSPYVSTTSFGGYANIRFSENFGSEVGVRRYVNPMSGRWTTSPIVTPYFRVGRRNKIEIYLLANFSKLPFGATMTIPYVTDRSHNHNRKRNNTCIKMKRLMLAMIVEIVLYAIICIVIYVAVSVLSGEIERWKKLIIFSVTYAILLPLVHCIIKMNRKRK